MTCGSLRGVTVPLMVGGLLASASCTMGTNTGNGANGATGGTPSFVPATGGSISFCVADPCAAPTSANGPNGVTYRGRVRPDTRILDGSGADASHTVVAQLEFSGQLVEETDAGCASNTLNAQTSRFDMLIASEDSFVDTEGTLHVHCKPRPATSCVSIGPEPWQMDLTLSSNGEIAASIFLESSDSDAGTVTQETVRGRIEAYFNVGPNGEVEPITIPSADGGTFAFPTVSPDSGCSAAY